MLQHRFCKLKYMITVKTKQQPHACRHDTTAAEALAVVVTMTNQMKTTS